MLHLLSFSFLIFSISINALSLPRDTDDWLSRQLTFGGKGYRLIQAENYRRLCKKLLKRSTLKATFYHKGTARAKTGRFIFLPFPSPKTPDGAKRGKEIKTYRGWHPTRLCKSHFLSQKTGYRSENLNCLSTLTINFGNFTNNLKISQKFVTATAFVAHGCRPTLCHDDIFKFNLYKPSFFFFFEDHNLQLEILTRAKFWLCNAIYAGCQPKTQPFQSFVMSIRKQMIS